MAKIKKILSTREDADQKLLYVFGTNLKKIREKKNLSQEQLAYEVGFSRSYYTEVETGKRNISLLNIIRIAAHLQIELDELIKLKDYKTKSVKPK
jgi:transcriptional regulator with XRE-family HTH domain